MEEVRATESKMKRIKELLRSGELSDVEFLVTKDDSNESIKAHRFVLASGSEVFFSMFCGPLAESNGIIEIPDVDYLGFKSVINYLYTGDVDLIDNETVFATLYAAKKYEVFDVVHRCTEYLKQQLDDQNCLIIWTHADLFSEQELAKRCLQIIDSHAKQIFKQKEFLNLDVNHLKILLQRDTLQILELDLFEATIQWAEQRCLEQEVEVSPFNVKAVLANVISFIRFPLMTVEEFAMNVSKRGILDDQDIIELFNCFILKTISSKYSCKTRIYVMERFSNYKIFQMSNYSRYDTFRVNSLIKVTGFEFKDGFSNRSSMNFFIEEDSKKIKTVNDFTESSPGKSLINFDPPVELKSNHVYKVQMTIQGCNNFCLPYAATVSDVTMEVSIGGVKFTFIECNERCTLGSCGPTQVMYFQVSV